MRYLPSFRKVLPGPTISQYLSSLWPSDSLRGCLSLMCLLPELHGIAGIMAVFVPVAVVLARLVPVLAGDFARPGMRRAAGEK